jgi:transposase-like protein
VAQKLSTCIFLNQYLHIKFSGRIGLDAIFVSVEGVSTAILIACDLDSLDIIDFGIYDSESEESWTDFLSNLNKSLNGIYPKIFVSDGKKGINNSLRKLYEFVPRQVCVAHKLRRLVNIFPQRALTKYERLIKDIANKTILSTTIDEFKENEAEFLRLVISPNLRSSNVHESVLEYRKALRARGVIRYQKSDFLTQFKYPDLIKEDRTNNALEGSVNSFLKTRINIFRGFKSHELFEYWIRLLVFYYRFHKFTSSKYKWRNKKRPIEINWDCDERKLSKILKNKTYSWIESLTKIG